MAIRKSLGLVGLLMLLLAIGVGGVLFSINQRTQARDSIDTKHGMVVSDFPPCTWDLGMPQRVLSENNSQTIVINATNTADADCQSELSLLAPGFDISPRKDTQTVTAKPQGQGSIAWIVIPHKSGSFDIVISDGLKTQVAGITVTNILGLTATQAQICSILGSLLGPMFTVPWWVERWQKRKRPKEQAPVAPPAAELSSSPPE